MSNPAQQKEQLLSYYIQQNEWVPTRPIGPIGAMILGPGPATVLLPTNIGEKGHIITKPKAPAYKIGIKTGMRGHGVGPGPGVYDIRGYTNKGKDVCLAPKMGIKLEPLKKFLTPGPADYSRGISDKIVFNRAPEYTMRIKPNPKSSFKTPAPNAYTLPETLGSTGVVYANKAPIYTMHIKPPPIGKSVGPGPAEYMLPSSNIVKCKAPQYTFPKASKFEFKRKGPGPFEHEAEKVKFTKYSTPKITFGIKHSQYKAFPAFAAEKY